MPLTLLLPLLLGTGFALQPPGAFHGGEPVARDGEAWLGLRVDGDDAALVAMTLSVRAVEDPYVDEAGDRSGQEVFSPGGDRVVMYLRGGALKPGRIERGSPPGDPGSWPQLIVFAGETFRIERECGPQPRDVHAVQLQFDCALVLHGSGRRQVLVELSGYHEADGALLIGDDAMPQLLFAGDLDRDGRLDLIFDTTDHYNVARPTLFLSTQAAPGELLGVAAQFQSVGC